jgi:hypothetical protein
MIEPRNGAIRMMISHNNLVFVGKLLLSKSIKVYTIRTNQTIPIRKRRIPPINRIMINVLIVLFVYGPRKDRQWLLNMGLPE